MAADFGAESNLETNFGTVVVAGRNVTPCQDTIAFPPPDQPFHFPYPFEVDDASNMSLGSQSANTKDESQPLLTPDNNTPFDDDDVALASRKDESVDDDNMAHAASLGDNMAFAGRQEVNKRFVNNVAPPMDTTTPWPLMAALEMTFSVPHRLVWLTPESYPSPQ